MHSSSRTFSRIARVVVDQLGAKVTATELQETTQLDQIVPLDSLALLEFAMGLEREFAIRFEPACMERDFLMDVPGLVNYLDGKCGVEAR